jgi:polyphosphate kinase 2 (PPK2 family)
LNLPKLAIKLTKIYKTEEPVLREALLDAQYELKERGEFPVIILINGVDGAGKGETINLLNEWMDPRLISTRAFGAVLMKNAKDHVCGVIGALYLLNGRIGILFGSWYTDPIIAPCHG